MRRETNISHEQMKKMLPVKSEVEFSIEGVEPASATNKGMNLIHTCTCTTYLHCE